MIGPSYIPLSLNQAPATDHYRTRTYGSRPYGARPYGRGRASPDLDAPAGRPGARRK